MPSAKKIAWAQLRVGVTAVVALALLGYLIFLLTGDRDLFAEETVIYTYMDDSAALTQGSPVRLNGILIGKISAVNLSGETAPMRVIRIGMEIDRKWLSSIPVDSVATISAENVLGLKYINIKKGQSPQTIQAKGELPSLDTREFDEVVSSGYALLTSLRGILERVDAIVGTIEAGKGSIGKLLVDEELYNRLTATVAEAQKVAAAISSGKGTVGRLLYDERLYEELRSTATRVDDLLAGVQQGQGTAGKFIRDPALYDDARKSVGELRLLMENLNQGQGTAGKLLKSEELHAQISRTLGKVEDTLDKINTGQGTLGQLLVNPQMYESMNGATRELHELMKDFRQNPKKFLRIQLSLF